MFFGTPEIAAYMLRYLLKEGVLVVGVVTQPDRPKGRSLQVVPSPVKVVAQEEKPDLPILQPEKASNPVFLEELERLNADLYVVVAFGQILSRKLLAIPRFGCINVHVSLLPKYRGAAPMQRCLLSGDKETGVSIQKMVYELDAGDVIALSKMEIPESMTLGELEKAMTEAGAPLLLKVLQRYEEGIPEGVPQDPSQVSWAPKIEVSELEIDWNDPAEKIHNQVRAFSPRPGAWCWLEKGSRRFKILRSRPIQRKNKEPPGTLIHAQSLVVCGEGALELIEVQPEGKKIMSSGDWLRGAGSYSCFP